MADKPVIVHISNTQEWAGHQRTLYDMLINTSDEYEHIIISTTKVGDDFKRYFPSPPHRIVTVDEPSYPFNSQENIKALRDAIESVNPAAAVSWTRDGNWCSGEIKRQFPEFQNLPIVWYIHSFRTPEELESKGDVAGIRQLNETTRYSFSIPAAILYSSETARQFHLDVLGFNPNLADVVTVGVDLSNFNRDEEKRAAVRGGSISTIVPPLSIGPDEPLIGTIARYVAEKDIPAFLKAAAEMTTRAITEGKPRPHFLLCGKGMEKTTSELVRLIDSYELSEYVHLGGMQHDMSAIYSALDLAVSTSQREAFGLSAVEALACGTSFVGTDVGMFRQILGTDGIVVSKRDDAIETWDPKQMVDAWELMLSTTNGFGREAMAERLRERAERYDCRVSAHDFEQVLERVIQNASEVGRVLANGAGTSAPPIGISGSITTVASPETTREVINTPSKPINIPNQPNNIGTTQLPD